MRGLSLLLLAGLLACKKEPAPDTTKPTQLLVEEKRGNEPLALLLQKHAGLARDHGLRPFLMFSADWCKPCVTFKRNTKTASIAGALEGTYLLLLDYDDWENEATSLGVDGIPTWIQLTPRGAPTQRILDSSDWKDPTPGTIAEAITPFFAK